MTNTDTTETETADSVPDEIDDLVGQRIHFLHSGWNLDTSPAATDPTVV